LSVLVIDTSALMAIALDEPEADIVAAALAQQDAIAMSAATVAEALIVADRRGVGAAMRQLIDGLGAEIVPVTRVSAHDVCDAYAHWGKGVHPAGLNFGDCFAYAVAKTRGCALLYVGEDFSQTDIPAGARKD
jgi:ribonuclease VapC